MKEQLAREIREFLEFNSLEEANRKYGKESVIQALAKDPCFKQPKKLIDLDEIGKQCAQEFYEEYGVYPHWWKDPYEMIEF